MNGNRYAGVRGIVLPKSLYRPVQKSQTQYPFHSAIPDRPFPDVGRRFLNELVEQKSPSVRDTTLCQLTSSTTETSHEIEGPPMNCVSTPEAGASEKPSLRIVRQPVAVVAAQSRTNA